MTMDVSKKTLQLIPEPEAGLYSVGKYSPRERAEKGDVYLEKSRELVGTLGLEGRVKEILIVDINHHEAFDGKNPYYVSSTVIQPSHSDGQSIGITCNKNGLLGHIDSYIEDNMDFSALAVVHPSLIDFIELLVKGRYNTKIRTDSN